MTAASPRRAFTLVELLVVVGLMAALLGLVVGGMRPTGATQVRQLSQAVSSSIIAARTRAIGAAHGSGLMFEPGGAVSVDACNTVFFASMPASITGLTGTAGMPPSNLAATSTTVTLTPTNGDATDLAGGYKIRFHRRSEPILPMSAWFTFTHTSGSSGAVLFRSISSQTISNTIWPTLSGAAALEFTIAGRPIKGAAALDSTKLAAIDLRFSGVGNTLSGDYGTLHGKGAVWLVFDREGFIDSVMVSGTGSTPTVLPLVPTAPVYLLVASVEDIQGNRSLQSETSRWLVIAPGSGRVSVAANVSVSGTTEADVNAARRNARQGDSGGAK